MWYNHRLFSCEFGMEWGLTRWLILPFHLDSGLIRVWSRGRQGAGHSRYGNTRGCVWCRLIWVTWSQLHSWGWKNSSRSLSLSHTHTQMGKHFENTILEQTNITHTDTHTDTPGHVIHHTPHFLSLTPITLCVSQPTPQSEHKLEALHHPMESEIQRRRRRRRWCCLVEREKVEGKQELRSSRWGRWCVECVTWEGSEGVRVWE